MSKEINIHRLGLVLRSEWNRNNRSYLFFITILTGIYIMGAFVGGMRGMQQSLATMVVFTSALTFFTPFILYSHLFNGIKGVNPAMQPASQSEKFIACMLQCLIVVPLGMLLCIWILSWIGTLLTGYDNVAFKIGGLFINNGDLSGKTYHLGFFESTYWGMISAQAVCIWGIHYFKSGKLWKTLLTICVVGIAVSLIGVTGILHIWNTGYDDAGVELVTHMGSERFKMIVNVFVSIFLPIILWIWAFLKMRKQQF